MSDWWIALTGSQQVFYVIAIISTAILILQLILNLIGLAGDDMDMDIDHDVDLPTDAGLEHPDLTPHSSGLGVISVRTVMAFFVGFGWAGAAALSSGWSIIPAVLVALAVGLVFLFVVFYLMRTIFRLSESGNVDYRNAVGKSGTVYLPVPAGSSGSGQIQVVVQGRLREITAMTDAKEDLPAGTPVQVVKVLGGSTMLVRKMEAES